MENRIKHIKSITPKGKKHFGMWRRTIRATPTVSKVLQHGNKMLKIDDDNGTIRTPRSEREIIKWRGLLRNTKYLSVTTPYVQSFLRERLGDSLLEVGKECDKKRREYWIMVRDGNPMESIRYDDITVWLNESEDMIKCFNNSDESDDEE